MGHTYWIVASATNPEGREATYALLKSRLQQSKLIEDAAIFDIPLGMKFGKLNDLMRLADDLIKQDTFAEQVCHRLERLGLEIDPLLEFEILWQKNTLSVDQYVSRFLWDEARFPSTRLLKQNADFLSQSVAKLDEEVRVKASLFAELKQNESANVRAESIPLSTRDLIDVLTPEICSAEDFVDTEHLITMVAVVPKVEAANIENMYWHWDENVAPGTLKRYPVTDKEGSAVYTFVCFKSCKEKVREEARKSRVTIRDFTYSPSAHKLKTEERVKLEAEKSKQESVLTRICLAAFSECFTAWLHLKAIRVFVECVLRYGVPPDFSAFTLKFMQLPAKVKESRLRKELDDILTSSKTLGKSYFGAKVEDSGEGEEEEFYPYVSIALTPFVQSNI